MPEASITRSPQHALQLSIFSYRVPNSSGLGGAPLQDLQSLIATPYLRVRVTKGIAVPGGVYDLTHRHHFQQGPAGGCATPVMGREQDGAGEMVAPALYQRQLGAALNITGQEKNLSCGTDPQHAGSIVVPNGARQRP